MKDIAKDARSQYVVKSNDIIRRARYSLTAQQQKIVLFAISKIKPTDTVHQAYKFVIEEMCAACGIRLDQTGYYYKALKDDIRTLTERNWCKMPDGSEKTISWIGDAEILPLSGTVTITFNPNMAPYLFELKEKYTRYRLENVLILSGKYSIRLYELLRSYYSPRDVENAAERKARFTLNEFRTILNVGSAYPRWAEFERNVIRRAVQEINTYSEDMQIEYFAEKKGRTVSDIVFCLRPPTALEMLNARKAKKYKLREV